ncbi:replication factor C subunit 1 [Sarracenia purpurea var. burkii]
MSDIRKWFMKQHDKNNGNAPKPAKPVTVDKPSPVTTQPEKPVNADQESSGRRKTSKYFASEKQKPKDKKEIDELSAKRKVQRGSEVCSDMKSPPLKKHLKVDDDDDEIVLLNSRKGAVDGTPCKKLKSGSGRGIAQKSVDIDESDEDGNDEKDNKLHPKSAGRGRGGRGVSTGQAGDNLDESDDNDNDTKSSLKASGRGRGGRGASAVSGGGRGRGGGGRGGFMNFGERKDPPHKGEKEVPEGAADCLAGLTFVISGTLDSLEREEAEDLIKRHGGRVTGSISRKTSYLLCDEDVGGRKSSKAKELGTAFLSEDGLFDMIRASNQGKKATKEESKKPSPKVVASLPKKSLQNVELKKNQAGDSSAKSVALKHPIPSAAPAKRKGQSREDAFLPWTEKYKPKVPNDIIGNQSLVKQLHEWLTHWNERFLNTGSMGKGKKPNDSGAKKAVLLSGTPGIGKTTSAKLVSQMLGFQTIEVNASDNRGKADARIEKGIGGSTANSIKELVSNEALSVKMDRSMHPKTVLIMDEVDGMSAGDRGGVADLIASIKISKIPIICICNDRYSQKLKSLVNYCLLLSFRKPTKQQMAKRLLQVANAEGLQVNEIALEELAERVNGDMRMALNHLQYMSVSMSVIKYDDIRQRLLSSAKDEDISPFTAVDKLFSFSGGKLRMDERINLSMSDPDLVPLIIQENYINYRPSSIGKDDNGIKRMSLIARAAESIADGDIINVQIRRYRQWQLSQSGTLASCIIPAALLHGQRETLEQGERNFNRFGGWLGKNSTMGKNLRLMEDLHVHLLASRGSCLERTTLRVDYLTLLLKQLADPLRVLPKDEAVEKVVEFMDNYSISLDDFDAVVEISKFKGHPNPLDGIQPAVKAALTKTYNKGSNSRVIRTADLISLPGIKRAPKKRVAAMLEPIDDGLAEENGDALAENEEENSSDSEDLGDTAGGEKKLQLDLQCLNSKGIQVDMDLKGAGNTVAKKASSGRGKGGSEAVDKKGGRGRGSGVAAKRKR